jgi:acyl-CoA reductase-like NAD-dependent aldehyde dehydrogenase
LRVYVDLRSSRRASTSPQVHHPEVIVAANDTHYGLAGSIWTENLSRAHRVVNELRAGQIWVNSSLAADPSMPISGHKQSGWGGERSSASGGANFDSCSVVLRRGPDHSPAPVHARRGMA